MQEQGQCSNCRKKFQIQKLDLHEVYCRRNCKPCPTCSQIVDKNYLEEHNQEFHKKVACRFCETQLYQKELQLHQKNCPKKTYQCEYCELNVVVTEKKKHQQFCGSRTKPCPQCRGNIKLIDFAVHQISCRQNIQKLRLLQEQRRLKQARQREAKIREEMERQRMQAQLLNKRRETRQKNSKVQVIQGPSKEPRHPQLIKINPKGIKPVQPYAQKTDYARKRQIKVEHKVQPIKREDYGPKHGPRLNPQSSVTIHKQEYLQHDMDYMGLQDQEDFQFQKVLEESNKNTGDLELMRVLQQSKRQYQMKQKKSEHASRPIRRRQVQEQLLMEQDLNNSFYRDVQLQTQIEQSLKKPQRGRYKK